MNKNAANKQSRKLKIFYSQKIFTAMLQTGIWNRTWQKCTFLPNYHYI